MKKSLLTLLALILCAGISFAATKNLRINKAYSKIETAAGVTVKYYPTGGTQSYVTISGPQDKIDLIDVKISGKTLEIHPVSNRHGNRNGNQIRGVVITVKGPAINSVEASSGSSFSCMSSISASSKSFDIEATSGASVSFGSLNVRTADVECSSGASVKIQRLTATKADFEVSSGADISAAGISASKLEAEASSGGTIKLLGKTEQASLEASSGGSIKASQLKVNHLSIDKSTSGFISVSK